MPGALVFARTSAIAFSLLPAFLPVAWIQPAQAGMNRCDGTLLQLQVSQSGSTAFDRFRFNLGVEAEGATGAEAIKLINARLGSLLVAMHAHFCCQSGHLCTNDCSSSMNCGLCVCVCV